MIYDVKQYLSQLYVERCNIPHDINEHLPKLKELAEQCNHVTEMGVRFGSSTIAFLNTDVTLRSYDLKLDAGVSELFELSRNIGKNVTYSQADVRKISIESTDLLFIDTFHIYDQLKIELEIHHQNVNKYIVMHDTHTFGTVGENGSFGLLPAMLEFLASHSEWRVAYHTPFNNGLTVLEK
jgi:hypothetical protein